MSKLEALYVLFFVCGLFQLVSFAVVESARTQPRHVRIRSASFGMMAIVVGVRGFIASDTWLHLAFTIASWVVMALFIGLLVAGFIRARRAEQGL